MAYVAPTTRATGFLVTPTEWNQDVVDNVKSLHDGRKMFFTPGAMVATALGTPPVLEEAGTQPYHGWKCVDADAGYVMVSFTRPNDWVGPGTLSFTLLHYSEIASGNVKTFAQFAAMKVAEGQASTAVASASPAITAGGSILRQELLFDDNISIDADDELISVYFGRQGSDGSDTLAGDWYIVGAYLSYN
jgi:hypothetical protein